MQPAFDKPLVRRGALALVVLGLLFAGLYLLLARGKVLEARHRPLDFAETFDFGAAGLADYSAYAQRRLVAAHPELADAELANLAPFRLEPAADCPRAQDGAYRAGIVLTHDLHESPYTLRALGRHFQESCFVVYGLLLPGHGTQAGDLLDTGWQDWFAAQRFAARELGREVENLYLAGHGVGATLALLEAATNQNVAGLILFAPQLSVQQAPWQAVAASAFGWLMAPARWAETPPQTTPYRDGSRPWRLLAQTNGLVVSTLAALPSAPAEIPVLTVLSREDATADPQPALDYMRARTHPLSHTLIFSAREIPATPGTSVRRSGFPEYAQLSLSHMGLMLPGSDPVFGRNGTSRECAHYFAQAAAEYERCMAGGADYRGEITPDQLALGVIQRMTYNPYFGDLVSVLNDFIAPVGRVIRRAPR